MTCVSNAVKEWIDEDLQAQCLDRLRKITNNQSSLECWIFQDNNQYYITDMSTRLKATIIPIKLSKLKSKLNTRHANEFELVKISIKQYLYSVMLNFNHSLKKSEPYVFIFVQDFDVKTGETGQLINKTDILRLKIASHPTMVKKTDKCGPAVKSSNQTSLVPETILRPTSKGNIQVDTQSHQSSTHKKDTIASTFQPLCNEPPIEREEEPTQSSDLSLLVRHLTPTCSGSYQDYTIDIIHQDPIGEQSEKADLNLAKTSSPAVKTSTESKNKPPVVPAPPVPAPSVPAPAQPTDLNHAFIKNTQSESTIVRDTMCTLDASECIDEPVVGAAAKLSTQLNSLPVFECSSIHVNTSLYPEPIGEPKPKSTSSIHITKLNNQDLIDSDQDDENDDSIEPTWEDKKCQEAVLVINDTQPCSTAAEQEKPSRMMRRQSSVSNLSEINSILDGSPYGNFTSSGRRKRKLLHKGNRASDQINDDAPSENDDVWEKQSRSAASKRMHKVGEAADLIRSFRSGRSLSSSSDSSSCSSSTVSFSTTTSSVSNSPFTAVASVDLGSKSLLFAPKHYYTYREKLYKKSFSEKRPTAANQHHQKNIAAIFSPRKKSSSDVSCQQKSAALVSCSSLDKHFESPTTTKLNSQVLDKFISIDNRANGKTTYRRRRLFDPKCVDIEETFEGKKSEHVDQLIGVEDATVAGHPAEQSNSTTTSLSNNAEKSIPSGQNPQLIINLALNKSPNSMISNDSPKDANLNVSDNNSVVEQVEVQNPMLNFNFGLNEDELHAYIVDNRTLAESSTVKNGD